MTITYNNSMDSKAASLRHLAGKAPMGNQIIQECDSIARMLLEKNISYGNSAINPISAFSNASAKERIASRIDDKINRLINGSEYPDDDTVLDLIGYLILYRIEDANSSPSS